MNRRTFKGSGVSTAGSPVGPLLFHFDQSVSGDPAARRRLLGGKGANLATLVALGLPVPPGLTCTTDACRLFLSGAGRLPESLRAELPAAMARLEAATDRQWGPGPRPLLISVRSGAAASMPGMLETILNVGLNDVRVEALVAEAVAAGTEPQAAATFAFQAYGRLLEMFGQVVRGIYAGHFQAVRRAWQGTNERVPETSITTEGWRELCAAYRTLIAERSGQPFPDAPQAQLEEAIAAVFRSWHGPRARRYRQVRGIDDAGGTAVTLQQMVFGNRGPASGTGVLFTRDPATGADRLYGEFLAGAQGQALVAGEHTPQPLASLKRWRVPGPDGRWRPLGRALFAELEAVKPVLEAHFQDVQDIEFTIEEGRLFFLQTRSAQRTATAALQIASDLVAAGVLDVPTALARLPVAELAGLLAPTFEPRARRAARVLARGLPASPGVAAGALAFHSEDAQQRAARGEAVLLIRPETSPDDLAGMLAARGILTSTGGMTSHAAVVARGQGRCAVVGATALAVDLRRGTVRIAESERVYGQGDHLSIDGTSGEIFEGLLPMGPAKLSGTWQKVLQWTDSYKPLQVLARIDDPLEARHARALGAAGVVWSLADAFSLAWPVRRCLLQQYLLAQTPAERERLRAALGQEIGKLLTAVRRAAGGLPLRLQLSGDPCADLLPQTRAEEQALAAAWGKTLAQVRRQVRKPRHGQGMCPPGAGEDWRALQLAAVARTFSRSRSSLRSKADSGGGPSIALLLPKADDPAVFAAWRAEAIAALTPMPSGSAVPSASGVEGAWAAIPAAGLPALGLPAVGLPVAAPWAALLADEMAVGGDFLTIDLAELTRRVWGACGSGGGGASVGGQLGEVCGPPPLEPRVMRGLIARFLQAVRQVRPGLPVGLATGQGTDPATLVCCLEVGMTELVCPLHQVPGVRLALAQQVLRAAGDTG